MVLLATLMTKASLSRVSFLSSLSKRSLVCIGIPPCSVVANTDDSVLVDIASTLLEDFLLFPIFCSSPKNPLFSSSSSELV